MYQIAFDPERRVLNITLTSFWSQATLIRFIADVGARGIYLLLRHGLFGVFVDCRSFPVQDKTIINGFSPILDRVAARGLPISLLFETTLCKLQAGRLATSDAAFTTTNEDDAKTWLAERIIALPRTAELASNSNGR